MKLVGVITVFLLSVTCSFSQVVDLRGKWKFHVDDNKQWASGQFDDSDWEIIQAPSAWEDQGFNGYDGFAWYRKQFDGTRLDIDDTYYLGLGYIDDTDEVYLNGKLVGFSGMMPPHFKTAYNKERRYPLAAEDINFNGKNTIAIRVFDVTNGGGIVDGSIGVFRIQRNKSLLIDLQGIWMFTPSWSTEPISKDTEWKRIMVPSEWEHQGFNNYDGYAWYKRTFFVPENFTRENLVLLLGKVDDFDKVYLNGRFIGGTNDHQPFGRSHSFSQERAYDIPPLALKRGVDNTIEVLVEDMGNIGGIYEGPVGITTRKRL